MCIEPVGDGAMRVTTGGGVSVIGGRGPRADRALNMLAPVLASLRRGLSGLADRWALWIPVAVGLGAAGYLAMAAEPPLSVSLLAPPFLLVLAALAKAWGR